MYAEDRHLPIRKRAIAKSDSSESEDEHPSKRVKASPPHASTSSAAGGSGGGVGSSFASKYMKKFGHVKGRGLGRTKQGRVEPVGLSSQVGRRGLGLEVDGIERSFNLVWDESKDDINLTEQLDWLPLSQDKVMPPLESLLTWMEVGRKKLTIDDEISFCDENSLLAMLDAKTIFDKLPNRELASARTRANPFETIKGAFFQNRAAMKTANIDSVLEFELTEPKYLDKTLMIPEDSSDLFYFADVCAGPGGFTEYILWRKAFNAHGFGFTLRGGNDFKLHMFTAACPEMFETFYGIDGENGSGDVTKPEYLDNFQKLVLDVTDGKGIHLFMADGGFSVEGQENIQEILSKRIYLCQFLCGISILREGGNFMCKLFDCVTPFSVSLIYLMHHLFDKISLFKPNTSRPANSERYLIGMSFCGSEKAKPIVDYMFLANRVMEYFDAKLKNPPDLMDAAKTGDPDQVKLFYSYFEESRVELEQADSCDVTTLVPLEIMTSDETFFNYIKQHNESFAKRQTNFLAKYKTYAQNTTLLDVRQHGLREQCLKLWNIPDRHRQPKPNIAPLNTLSEILDNENSTWIAKTAEALFGRRTDDSRRIPFKEVIPMPFQYCMMMSAGDVVPLLGLGRSNIFIWQGNRFDSIATHKFTPNVQIPARTLALAEICMLYKGEGRGQIGRKVIRLIDAYMLAGVNISDKPFYQRHLLIEKFCKAIDKSKSNKKLDQVLCAELIKPQDFPSKLEQFKRVKVKGEEKIAFSVNDEKNNYFVIGGMHFINAVSEPWTISYSRSQKRPYFFNQKTGVSLFEFPENEPQIVKNFNDTFTSRKFWKWNSNQLNNILPLEQVVEHENSISSLARYLSNLMGN